MIRGVVLVVGGSGTLGRAIAPLLLEDPKVDRIRILSRGEHRQMEMAQLIPSNRIDYLIGDVRDYERVERAAENCMAVFHFAAVKSIDRAEYDPEECLKTNVLGTENVIRAARKCRIEKAIFTSTDKAVAPLNLYGASKLVAEKLFIQGNVGRHRSHFSVCRYGNVLGSNGSVIDKWRSTKEKKERYKLTDGSMTRFFISQQDAARFVYKRWHSMNGGEVFIPKMKSIEMQQLLYAFDPQAQYDVIGVRPGEKLHECLISRDEAGLVTDAGTYFVRWPSHDLFPIQKMGSPMPETEFTSFNASRFTAIELRAML